MTEESEFNKLHQNNEEEEIQTYTYKSYSPLEKPQAKHSTFAIVVATVIVIFLSIEAFLSGEPAKVGRTISAEANNQLAEEQSRSEQTRTFSVVQPRNDILSHPPFKEHLHPIKAVASPTLGASKPYTFFNFTRVCGADFRKYESMMDGFFKPYNDTDCEETVFGSKNDQSYILCSNILNHSTALFNLGLEGDDSFGCAVSSQFGIPNYLLECLKVFEQKSCDSPAAKTLYEKKCMGEQVETIEGYDFTTLDHEIESKGYKNKPIIVKMDIEGAQWQTLRYFPVEYLSNIDQLVLQVHLPKDKEAQPSYWGNIDILNSLSQHFVSVHMHMNNFGRFNVKDLRKQNRMYISSAFEVTLVNKKLIAVKSDTRSYHERVKNLRNNPNDDEIQMFS